LKKAKTFEILILQIKNETIVYEGLQYGGNRNSIAFRVYDLKCDDVTTSNTLKYKKRCRFENDQDIKEGDGRITAEHLEFLSSHLI